MQSVKLKNGVELISMELKPEIAAMDIIRKLLDYAKKTNPKLMEELAVNLPNATGAIALVRVSKEMVDMDGCSKEYVELLKGQRDLIDMLVGDKEAVRVGDVESRGEDEFVD